MDLKAEIKSVAPGDEYAISQLVRDVFNEYIAPDYSPQGVAFFLDYNDPGKIAGRLLFPECISIKALMGDELAGYAGIRDHSHVCQFFVKKKFQGMGMGIGRLLFADLLDRAKRTFPEIQSITVHSSPYAVPIYEKLGFRKIAEQTEKEGMLFTPMSFEVKR